MTEDEKPSTESESIPKTSTFKGKEKREKSRPLTKIVCRRLPPNMDEEEFMEQVSPIPEHDYFYFAKPDNSLTPDLFSRAYINFVNVEDIFLFRDKFDDYIFLDNKGNEYPAVVEYAPFQRLPKKRRKKDLKSGTIESDSTYIEFLESLKETDSDSREPKMEYSYQPTEEKKETTTPLLEFLAARRRDERRRREERQRRKPRSRKEDDIPEEDVKKIKPRDNEKEKTYNKKKEDDVSWQTTADSTNVELKESKYVKGSNKSFREQRKSVDEQRKKTDIDKKDFSKLKDADSPAADEKSSRKDRKERLKEIPTKVKEVKKYSDTRRDKLKAGEKRSDKLPSFRKVDDDEQDDIINSSIDSKVIKNSIVSQTSEATSDKTKIAPKASLISSNIKPFTQLPQYKAEDLTKVIEELDKSVSKLKMEGSKLIGSITPIPLQENTDAESDVKTNVLLNTPNDEVTTKSTKIKFDKSIPKDYLKSSKSPEKKVAKFSRMEEDSLGEIISTNDELQQRRSSLESSEKKSPTDETPLRRHKSLDDKSQDMPHQETKYSSNKIKNNEPKSERRIRNKDRPSIAIYQPGMGRFSKQRLEREKDSTTGTYKAIDPNDKLQEE